MRSLWKDSDAPAEPLAARVYSSRLLGADPTLVLHGGGNTSVKVEQVDFFGAPVDVLYVKGSGWDLKTIEVEGFSPVRLDVLLKLAARETLTDVDMVREQRAAMLNPDAPNPSVEAILHALLPHRFVDHTHADAVVTITNTPTGAERIQALYGERVIVIPYVMPGFVLARAVQEAIAGADWDTVEGLILLNHGVFTFGSTAKVAYERMIALVAQAEQYLVAQNAWDGAVLATADATPPEATELAALRRAVSRAMGVPVVASTRWDPSAAGYASRSDVDDIATRGPVTPDHIIRTKQVPLVVGDGLDVSAASAAVAAFVADYDAYFRAHAGSEHQKLVPAPRFAVWRGRGLCGFGATLKDATIVSDLAAHTLTCIQRAEALDRWQALPPSDLFEMEYWSLEQAKLKRGKARARFAGKVAIVTGAASGIGKACAALLHEQGAVVVGLDISSDVRSADHLTRGVVCDVTDTGAVDKAVVAVVAEFGGLDLVVSNAGSFPPSASIAELDDERWQRSLDLNLSSHLKVLRAAAPMLALGVEPAVVFIGSKNVPAPGPGAAAYSAAKAGLAQLARIAALELGSDGVRVNTVHPNAVFDTGIWDDDIIAARADAYGQTPDAYRRNNVLAVELCSSDVARTVLALLDGESFRATTGAQVPVDGGNERVI